MRSAPLCSRVMVMWLLAILSLPMLALAQDPFRAPKAADPFVPTFGARVNPVDARVEFKHRQQHQAEVTVVAGHDPVGAGYQFDAVPLPAVNDAAAKATFTLVDGQRDRNGGDLTVLHDGRVPRDADQPAANFFFRAGTDGGRIVVDLGRPITVAEVNTYSWHPNTRGPQVYRLYGSAGTADGFDPQPKRGADPVACGWTFVAGIDTRPPAGDGGGQHAVSVRGLESLGKLRYLLFDISRTETRDPFGNTFYSEIDVVDADAPPPAAIEDRPVLIRFEAEEGKYRFTIDATGAPDLQDWAAKELQPVVQAWYPRLVAMLPSDGFEPPSRLTLVFRDDMGGTPASAGGGRVNMNSGWFRRELNREARGAVVHELVHVVQDYGRASRANPRPARNPGWLVEGIADYIRWFLYEPEAKGAEITERNLARASYDASYRVSANFLNWVTEEHDRDLIRKLNAAAREGKYSNQLWQQYTGRTLEELGEAWKETHAKRLGLRDETDP